MQEKRIRELRRSKIEFYRGMLPPGSLPEFAAELVDDMGYARCLHYIARAAPPGLGLVVGSTRHPSYLGTLYHVMMSCATLGEVVDLWLLFAGSAGDLLRYENEIIEQDGTSMWSWKLHPAAHLSKEAADLCVHEVCSAIFRYAREVTGSDLTGYTTELPAGPIPGLDYSKYLPGNVVFNAPVARVVGPASALQRPVVSSQSDMFEALIKQFTSSRSKRDRMGATRLQLYDVLMKRPGGPVTLAAAASAMAMSPRSLCRRLQAENTSFGSVLDDYRRCYALALAEDGSLKAKQIAHIVGFRSENGLRKAFKKWTGQPIGSWSPASRKKRRSLG